MSKQAKRRRHRQSARPLHQRRPDGRAPAPNSAPDFAPVPLRGRHDGWTPGRQLAFVQALAACLCVTDACAAVGMSPRSYYDLARRPGAEGFRRAVDAALDVGVQRLEDALIARALHGEAVPVFYRGEQVGERRRYDNRLALSLLRARSPERYGRWRDRVGAVRGHPDGAAALLAEASRRLAEDAAADRAGRPRPAREPLRTLVADALRGGGDGEGADGEDHGGPGGLEGPVMKRAFAAWGRGDDALGDAIAGEWMGRAPLPPAPTRGSA